MTRGSIPLRWAASLLGGLALLAPSWAAISVSDVSVAPKPNNGGTIILSYRLNQAATAVDIAISNGTHLTGPTAKGTNQVEYKPPTGGLSATITATGPQEAGTGGAVQLVPVTRPATTNPTGIDWFKRPDSPYRGDMVLVSGFGQTSKRLYLYASDGTPLNGTAGKDISSFGSGSFPLGVAVALNDPFDRVYVGSRTQRNVVIFTPSGSDLVTKAGYTITTDYSYPGLSVAANGTTASTTDFEVFQAFNKNGSAMHFTVDFASDPPAITTASPKEVASSKLSGSTTDDVQSLAVDATSQVMFKAQVHDSGIGPLSELDATNTTACANLSKWTSTNGVDWSMDVTWGENVIGLNGIPETGASCYGVALDAGFDVNDLANSKVWACIGGGSPAVRKLYHIRADNGEIIPGDTIDLSAVTLIGTGTMADKTPRMISVSRKGNIALILGSTTVTNGTDFTVLAPNTSGPTTDSFTASIDVPLIVTCQPSSVPTIGNSGVGQATFHVDVYNSSGITADNTQVTMDLSAVGGSATQPLTAGTISADGKSGAFTLNYTVPATAAAGQFDLPVAVTTTSGKTGSGFITQTVYNGYKPDWAITTEGGANSSPLANGKWAYIGTDAGKVYAVDATTGAPMSAFGAGGVVSLGEPITGKLQAANGKLYAAGNAHVFILDIGTGKQLANPAIADPVIAVVPNGTDPALANRLAVGSSDQKVRLLDATTGAQKAVSADLGAKVLSVAVGPTAAYDDQNNPMGFVVVAGTDAFADTTGGRIYMLAATNLTNAFPIAASPVLIDAKGAVKSRAAFGLGGASENIFAIGGASGLWGVNADNGDLLAWTVDVSAGSNGNPYGTATAVDANPSITQLLSGTPPAIHFATAGGSQYTISGTSGARISWAGDPIPLATNGAFAAGGGILGNVNNDLAATPAKTRRIYLGSDSADKRFFSIVRNPDDSTFGITPGRKWTFDPADTATFPASLGAVPGAFNSTPAMAGTEVVVGSAVSAAEGRFYGFPALMTADTSVVSVTPANGASGVATSVTVAVVFSADMSSAPLDNASLKLLDASGNVVDASLAVQADTKTVTITPSSPLTANKTYAVVVEPALGQPFTSTFYTGVPPTTKGDVNGDGRFDSQDVKDALKMASGLLPSTAQALTAVNKAAGAKIGVEDALLLDRVLNGKASL